ncbi:pyrroline-5-carboxylate reductase family protein [Fructilactobacillus carniphilus]|uniref:Pyrroline-5-carboxylate reductase n=1 Tax=Fructilactobacillus carniphilus TaxID=2940297 RepID=A0ABY5BWY5_9LACO|nr:pyrroline-5-carboxylate reductase [Fructilactobacillus carniphilus]USS90314.1 pyrroline-5-carboxylate reductase [Fructilactobacillus carniphilus]
MKIGILGAGHMGSSIIRGLANCYSATDLLVKGHRVTPELQAFQREIGFQLLTENDFSAADVLFVTTPAPATQTILRATNVANHTIIISAVQGITPAQIQDIFPTNSAVCIIPNIPVAVNAGCIAMTKADAATPADQKTVDELLAQLGTIVAVPATNAGIVGTVAGCGPAFVDVFMSALADAAVQNGLDRKTAYQVAASMVFGSAKLALETGTNPDVLKDQVTSPGGSTIKGVVGLDEKGFRNAVNHAVNQANG